MQKHSLLSWILAPALVIGSVVLLPGCRPGRQPASSDSPLALADLTNQVTALRAEVERLKGLVPDQAHAMADVGYHFANLWFAVAQTNWPLADFYLGETRSHLLWAIRIHPVRQIQSVQLDLGGVLDAVDKTYLATLKASIASQDTAKFDGLAHGVHGLAERRAPLPFPHQLGLARSRWGTRWTLRGLAKNLNRIAARRTTLRHAER
jgi:hypothetical protein